VTVWVPDTGRLPLHPPVAAHEVALLEDQVRFEDDPTVIDAGLAAIDAVGTTVVTDTVVVCETLPLGPLQVSV